MAWGLKAVRYRRSDALSRVGWDELEALLAEHYRREGYLVEHVGTGGNARRFDGGIDLKLRRDDAYVLVQSKHWNAYQVTHNAVHELLGLMVNEGATGAILVTSGEFTRAAIEAATRHDYVQLVDGDDLRAMLGTMVEPEGRSRVGDFVRVISTSPDTRRLGRALNDRVVSEVESFIRGGRRSGYARSALMAGFWLMALKILGALLLFWFLTHTLRNVLQGVATRQPPVAAAAPSPTNMLPSSPGSGAVVATAPINARVQPPQTAQAIQHSPTPEEIRESQRKAEEAMKIIEATTPEM